MRAILAFISPGPIKKNGRPDMRYSENKHWWKGYNNGTGKKKKGN
tara:strand:+ start:312 stop:446 length:135 start_codon:yes stop_codon:yes gene_type:complete